MVCFRNLILIFFHMEKSFLGFLSKRKFTEMRSSCGLCCLCLGHWPLRPACRTGTWTVWSCQEIEGSYFLGLERNVLYRVTSSIGRQMLIENWNGVFLGQPRDLLDSSCDFWLWFLGEAGNWDPTLGQKRRQCESGGRFVCRGLVSVCCRGYPNLGRGQLTTKRYVNYHGHLSLENDRNRTIID